MSGWLVWLRDPLRVLFCVLVFLAAVTAKHDGPMSLVVLFAALAAGTALVSIGTEPRR